MYIHDKGLWCQVDHYEKHKKNKWSPKPSLCGGGGAAGAGPYISVTFHGCHSRDTLNATFPATHTYTAQGRKEV